MAVTNPIAPFLWGKGGVAMSPEQVAREREIAALLMQQGDPAFKDAGWLGILGRGLEGGLSGWKERQADEAERAGREGFQSQWDSAFGGGTSPVASALAGGGAASQLASTANTPPSVTNISGNKQAFVDALLPAAMEASARTGVDPRIIIAQAAQETGWGKSAPGNNYFGIKSHGQGGGQTLNTHEYVNGQRVNVSDSFRTFGSPEESVAGYADFLLANPRYRPMMAAQGLDAQLEALGASGYATDPEYANSVGSIARGITIPDGFSGASAAPAQVAQGPDMAALLGLAGNQWANPQQQAVVQALMGQQIQQQDPRYQQQLAMGDLQMQQAQLELEAMRNPAAPAPNLAFHDGMVIDMNTGGIVQDYRQQGEDLTDTQRNLAWRAEQAGLAPGTPEYAEFMRSGGQSTGMALSVGPDGTVQFAQGSAAGKPLTEGQSKDAVYFTRASGALPIIDQLEDALLSYGEYVAGSLPAGLGNFMQSEDYQVAQNAGKEFLASILRKDTGAAVTPSEEALYGDIFLPRPGDKPGALARKRQARALALNAIEAGMPISAIENAARALVGAGIEAPNVPSTMQQPQSQPNTTSSGVTWSIVD